MRRYIGSVVLVGCLGVGGCALIAGYDFEGYGLDSGGAGGLGGAGGAGPGGAGGEAPMTCEKGADACERGAACVDGVCRSGLRWVKGLPGKSRVAAVTVDATGNVIVVGEFAGVFSLGQGVTSSNAGSVDVLVVKFDPNGEPLWARGYGSAGLERATSVATDSEGGIFVAGLAEGKFGVADEPEVKGTTDAFVLTLDSEGNMVRARRMGATGTSLTEPPRVVALSGGACVVAGTYVGTIEIDSPETVVDTGEQDIFAARFDSDGKLVWTDLLGGTGDQVLQGLAAMGERVALSGTTGNGLGFIAGTACAPQLGIGGFNDGPGDAFLAVLTPSADCDFATRLDTNEDQLEAARGVAFSSGGDLVVGVDYPGPTAPWFPDFAVEPGVDDMFVGRLQHLGGGVFDGIWSTSLLAQGARPDHLYALASNQWGGVALGGAYGGAVSFTNRKVTIDENSPLLAYTNNTDLQGFLARLDEEMGKPIWQLGFGDLGDEVVLGVAMAPGGALAAVGTYSSSFEVLPGAPKTKLPALEPDTTEGSFVLSFDP